MEQPKNASAMGLAARRQKEKAEYDRAVQTFVVDQARKEIALKVVNDMPRVKHGKKEDCHDYAGAAQHLIKVCNWPMAACAGHLAIKLREWAGRDDHLARQKTYRDKQADKQAAVPVGPKVIAKFDAVQRVNDLCRVEKLWREELLARLRPNDEPEPFGMPQFNNKQAATMQHVFKKKCLQSWCQRGSFPEPVLQCEVPAQVSALLRVFRGHSKALSVCHLSSVGPCH